MHRIFKIIVVFLSVWSFNTLAIDPTYTGFFSSNAIKGYDTVAYFTEGKAVKGDKSYEAEYQEATWLFSSQQNLDLFVANPEKYAPQYGGYCAYGIANDYVVKIDPAQWKIVDDKLYLNYDSNIQKRWLKNIDGYIVAADRKLDALLAK